jgi:hypothetical protein
MANVIQKLMKMIKKSCPLLLLAGVIVIIVLVSNGNRENYAVGGNTYNIKGLTKDGSTVKLNLEKPNQACVMENTQCTRKDDKTWGCTGDYTKKKTGTGAQCPSLGSWTVGALNAAKTKKSLTGNTKIADVPNSGRCFYNPTSGKSVVSVSAFDGTSTLEITADSANPDPNKCTGDWHFWTGTTGEAITGTAKSTTTADFSSQRGKVTAITITTPGSGYTAAPTITFSGGGSGNGAVATATVSGGAVTAITITTPGSGYTAVPTIAFSGGGGGGAVATATVAGL